MERKEPTPSEDPIHGASTSLTSPHRGDSGGGTPKPKRNDHDVFLSSISGTWSTLFHDLRHGLVIAGIDTFCSKDYAGEGIPYSLPQSKISIPIFGPYFVDHESGLRELVHIWKCKRSSGQIVLPIFDGVGPSEVQLVEGRYVKDFSSHEGRVDEMELGERRKALAEVGSLRGWEAEKFAYGKKGALVELVVARVVSLLKTTFKLPTELVGIDDHVKSIKSSIDPKYNDRRIIGIRGVRGSGKTTLAKALWNDLSGDFEHLSFLPNIREVSLRMGIECLQEELICNIPRSPHALSNVDERIGIITSQFINKKVLVILDDMDNNIHLDALIGDGSWLKAGSMVIITTRNMSILNEAKADPKYELNHWTTDQALTLFSRHLFGKDSPPEDYEHMCRDVVLGIPRIPLILELIGSSFCQKLEVVRKRTLMGLINNVNNKEDKNLLRITYESLDYEQQQIFLDIACLFIGSSKQNPTYMWDSCGFLPKKGLEVLRKMSLIETDEDDKLIMHDRFRDFAREIVHLEHQKELQQPSRLWICEEAQHVLDNNKGTNMIQAICLEEQDSKRSYTGENFKGLTNLRYLKVCGANFTGDFENMLSELRWLHWERCPSNFVATNFHPKQLVVLNLSRSEISEDWGGWGPIKMATKLKVLNLSSCPFLRTLDLSTFESLETLILEKCENLEEIHPSIMDSKSLVSLNVSGCRRLEKLPTGVGKLEELKELLMNDTAIQEIPMSGDGLMKLETLNASCCGRLEELPPGVGRMENLRELLINDTSIRNIPMSGRGLKKLKTLSASGCKSLEKLPTGVDSMHELRELLINDTAIQEIRISGLPKLKTLCASYCEDLVQLHVNNYCSLTKLDLSHSGIEELPRTFYRLTALTQLDLSYSWIENLPKSFDSRSSLTQLDLSHSGIRKFPKFGGDRRWITQLDLSHTGIEELPKSMDSLKALTHLNLSYLGIKQLPPSMGDLVSLQHLFLQGCWLLRYLPDSIERLTSLTKLDLQSIGIAELPQGMQNMKNLKFLDIRGTNILRLPDRFSFALPDLKICWERM